MTRSRVVLGLVCLLGPAAQAQAQDNFWSLRLAGGYQVAASTSTKLPDGIRAKVKAGPVVSAEVATTLTPRFSGKIAFWSASTPVTFNVPGSGSGRDRMLQSIVLLGFSIRGEITGRWDWHAGPIVAGTGRNVARTSIANQTVRLGTTGGLGVGVEAGLLRAACRDCGGFATDIRVTWLPLPIGLSTGDRMSYALVTSVGVAYRF